MEREDSELRGAVQRHGACVWREWWICKAARPRVLDVTWGKCFLLEYWDKWQKNLSLQLNDSRKTPKSFVVLL